MSSSSCRLAGLALCPCETTTAMRLAMSCRSAIMSRNTNSYHCHHLHHSFICPLIVRWVTSQTAARCSI